MREPSAVMGIKGPAKAGSSLTATHIKEALKNAKANLKVETDAMKTAEKRVKAAQAGVAKLEGMLTKAK